MDNSRRFFADQDLIAELRAAGDPLSLRAAESIHWLRDNMIDPAEYMRVSNERGHLLSELTRLGHIKEIG